MLANEIEQFHNLACEKNSHTKTSKSPLKYQIVIHLNK
jgi:hypothetical protein